MHTEQPFAGGSMNRFVLVAAVGLLSTAFISARTSAQAPPATDVNAALIRELHDLRLAIEKLASTSSRVQVLSARASQHEQRITTLTTELITLNGKLAEAAAEAVFANSRLEQLKERVRTEADPKQRALLEQEQDGFAIEAGRRGLTQSSLQAQADAIRQQIAAEQSGLAEIERRLDELERPADSQR